MMLRAYALTADENGRFQEAAASYEAALLADPADLEATVNLAVLYWQATGRGRGASGALPQEFLKHAQKRLRELLGSDSAGEEAEPEAMRLLVDYSAQPTAAAVT
jgi:tetratricopeptide (TPR) repeat protein